MLTFPSKLTLGLACLAVFLTFSPEQAHAVDYPVCPYEPTALAPLGPLINAPYVATEEMLERMQCLDLAFRARHDRRAIFMGQYVRTTVEVAGAIENGEFLDAEWTERYMIAFSDLYRQALVDYEAGRFTQMSPAWRIAFDTSKRGDALAVQELILGINAHINGDLPLALQRARLEPNRAQKMADHYTVNSVLERVVDEQMYLLSDLYAPGLQEMPRPVIDAIEGLLFFSMQTGRANAWNNAVTLWNVRYWPPSRLWQEGIIKSQAATGAYAILLPGLSPQLISVLRDIERSEGVWPTP